MTSHNQTQSAGSGLCYSLALFISHEANVKYVLAEVEMMAADGALRFESDRKIRQSSVRTTIERLAATRWFSWAARSIQDIQLGTELAPQLVTRIEHLRAQCSKWSAPVSPARGPLLVNVHWAIQEAKELIRLIDESRGIRTVKESDAFKGLKEPALIFRL